MLLVFSSKVEASKNVGFAVINALALEKEGNTYTDGKIKLVDVATDSILEVPDLGEGMLVLSPHKASSGIPAFTTHTPGNPASADFGGKPRTLNTAMPSLMRNLLSSFLNHAPEGFEKTYEADHHGPTITSPIAFVELGSTEKEWKSREFAEALAEAVLEGIRSDRRYEVFVGFGGNHYASKFTEYALKEEVAFAHLIPKYALDGIDESVFKQSITKSIEKVKAVLIDKKGMNSKQRGLIEGWAEAYGIEAVRI